jgi:hypothetical protein
VWLVLLALAFATVGPAVAAAQARVPTIGVLIPSPATSPTATPAREAFEGGLKERGWTPGCPRCTGWRTIRSSAA